MAAAEERPAAGAVERGVRYDALAQEQLREVCAGSSRNIGDGGEAQLLPGARCEGEMISDLWATRTEQRGGDG